MLAGILKSRRLLTGAALFAGAAALLALGCIAQLTLSDIRYVPHAGVRPVLKMGKDAHGKRGVDCVDCHAGAKKEARAGMPDRAFCMVCHEVVDWAEVRAELVPGGPFFDTEGRPKWKTVTAVAKGVIFSHAKHTGTLDCAECHGDVAHEEYGLVDLAARYANCRRCHIEEESSGECATCHSALDESSRPHSHDPRWGRTHGRHVRDIGGLDQVDETCNSCHSNSHCVSCHKEERPRDHTIFWTRAGHGLAADIDRERCAACHTEDRCVRCHLGDTPPLPPLPHPPPASNCDLCHTGLRGHVIVTDNCMFCHR